MVVTNFQVGDVLYAANLNEAFANSVNVSGDSITGPLTVTDLTITNRAEIGHLTLNGIDIGSGLTYAQVTANSALNLAKNAFNKANTANGGINSTTQTILTTGGLTVNNRTSLTVPSNNTIVLSANIGNTTQPGIVQLNDTWTSNLTTRAATANIIFGLYTKIAGAIAKTGGVMTGKLNANANGLGIVIANSATAGALAIQGIDIGTGLIQAKTNANSALNLVQNAYVVSNTASITAAAAYQQANLVGGVTSQTIITNGFTVNNGTRLVVVGNNTIILSANIGNTTQRGIVQLDDTVISTSKVLAATANSLRTTWITAMAAFNRANASAANGAASQTIITANGLTINNGTTLTVTGNNVIRLSANLANTTKVGVVQLNDTITSTSTSQAATANAVNTVWATANAAFTKANIDIVSIFQTTLTVNAIPNQTANVPFQVSGLWSIGPVLNYKDDAGSFLVTPTGLGNTPPKLTSTWNFTHPGMANGVHTIFVKDTNSNTTNSTIVTIASGSTPIVNNLTTLTPNSLYYLNYSNPSLVPAQIAAATQFQVKVIEPYSSPGSTLGTFTGAQVTQMKTSTQVLLAYFSIGEAENFRYYFSSLTPSIIGPENTQFAGDFQVAYWTQEWRDICTTEIQKYMNLGFDGIFLDVVDEYEQAWAIANVPGGTALAAKTAMTDLVSFLSNYAKSQNPNFNVWQNNAEELYANTTYVGILNGCYKENLFYKDDGNIQTTSETNSSLVLLQPVRNASKPVCAIEYVVGTANANAKIIDVRTKAASNSLGFYCTTLDLDHIALEGLAVIESANATTITSVGPEIINSVNERWSITVDNRVAVNGDPDVTTSGVVLLYYSWDFTPHRVYQQNNAGNWYYKAIAADAWVGPVADPTQSPGPPPSGNGNSSFAAYNPGSPKPGVGGGQNTINTNFNSLTGAICYKALFGSSSQGWPNTAAGHFNQEMDGGDNAPFKAACQSFGFRYMRNNGLAFVSDTFGGGNINLGAPNWTKVDKFISGFQQSFPLTQLMVCFARGDVHFKFTDSGIRTRYAQAIVMILQKMAASGISIPFVQVVNEPDNHSNENQVVSIANLTLVEQAVRNAVHAVFPNTLVGGPTTTGLRSPTFGENYITPSAAGGSQFIAFHRYTKGPGQGMTDDALYTNAYGNNTNAAQAQADARAGAPGNYPIFITEYNIDFAPIDGPGLNDARQQTYKGAIYTALTAIANAYGGLSGACLWRIENFDDNYGPWFIGTNNKNPNGMLLTACNSYLGGNVASTTINSTGTSKLAALNTIEGTNFGMMIVNYDLSATWTGAVNLNGRVSTSNITRYNQGPASTLGSTSTVTPASLASLSIPPESIVILNGLK